MSVVLRGAVIHGQGPDGIDTNQTVWYINITVGQNCGHGEPSGRAQQRCQDRNAQTKRAEQTKIRVRGAVADHGTAF